MLGALLPDIIDKPLGHLILPQNNGRIFAHTILFALIVFTIGLLWQKAMPLAYGVITHHLLDNMYLDPVSSLWPLMGPFESSDFSYMTWLDHLVRPIGFLGEVAGLALIAWWSLGYLRRRPRTSKTIYN
jgi:membrane-bound metal-dependent hydrolase YbcI (DUF457 family)